MAENSSPRRGKPPAEIDTNFAHASRVYDYLLGGTDNFEIDRATAQHLAAALGGLDIARADVIANRDFLVRAVRHLTSQGIRQFLDIGTGVPNATNTLAVAQDAAPDARVVCVDNDPIVLAHAHQLIRSTPEGAAVFVDADVRDPHDILSNAAQTLDLSKPVGLILVAIMHALGDLGDHSVRQRIVSRLIDAVPSGSYLAMSHIASDIQPIETEEAIRRMNETAAETYVTCSTAEFARFFDGLELIGPGVTLVGQWQPDEAEPVAEGIRVTPFHAAVGRKP